MIFTIIDWFRVALLPWARDGRSGQRFCPCPAKPDKSSQPQTWLAPTTLPVSNRCISTHNISTYTHDSSLTISPFWYSHCLNSNIYIGTVGESSFVFDISWLWCLVIWILKMDAWAHRFGPDIDSTNNCKSPCIRFHTINSWHTRASSVWHNK